MLTVEGFKATLKVALTEVAMLTPDAPDTGDTDVTVGVVLTFSIVKAFVSVPLCASVLVTVTLRVPAVALAE